MIKNHFFVIVLTGFFIINCVNYGTFTSRFMITKIPAIIAQQEMGLYAVILKNPFSSNFRAYSF